MSLELVDVEELRRLRIGKDKTVEEMARILGLSRTAVYELFRDGKLPKNLTKRRSVLAKLSKYFGVEVRQILLRLEPRKTA